MVYVGSKNRIAKEILNHTLKNVSNRIEVYYEPFVGGANIIDKVNLFKRENNLDLKLIGSDKNRYLISMLDYLSHDGHFKYKFIEKDEWIKNYLHPFKKNELNLPTYEIGYLGITKTFRGKFMNGYFGIDIRDGKDIQFYKHNNIIKQQPNLKGIEFKYCDYNDLNIQDNSIIYLDPPYKGTIKYIEDINHDELYQWCCNIKDKFNNVHIYLSELNSIGDRFKEIWNKDIVNNMKLDKTIKMNEKLFELI